MEKAKYDERNKVNYLDGKNWIKNAVNYWEVDNLSDLEDRMKKFTFKERASGVIFSNLKSKTKKAKNIEYDTTIIKIDNISEFDEKTIKIIINSGYNSYHWIVLDNVVIDNYMVSKYIVDNCLLNNLEYRGKIVVKIKNKYLIALLFLNRIEEKQIKFINDITRYLINSDIQKEIFINSKSKIDKIGLKHPAPYSYNDIEKLCEINNIKNQIVLDPFLGIGSTIIGVYKNNNYTIGIELNKEYVELIDSRFELLNIREELNNRYNIINGDSLVEIDKLDNKIDCVITSPPYFNILKNKNKGVRHDNSQSRQGVEFYSEDIKDIGNLDEYDNYILKMKELFQKIRNKINNYGKVYIVISDFTVNKKEKDVHSDYLKFMNDIGYIYTGTSYLVQNQKVIYPFGYPYKIVLNHINQYVMCFEVRNEKNQ